jgi:hypothetical protein
MADVGTAARAGARGPVANAPSGARAVLAPFVVSRAIADGSIVFAATLAGHRVLGNGFAVWDGRWYTGIARLGYAVHFAHLRQTAWAFFPLLPVVIRAAGRVGVPGMLGGVAVSHAAFFVALLGLHRLLARHGSPRAATIVVWLLALFPASIAFSMIYPSALFLAASVWAFALVDEHRDVMGGVVAALAALSRPNGIVVAIALAFAVGWCAPRLVRVCGPSVVALASWMLFNLVRTGDALRFVDAKQGWHEVTLLGLVEHPTVPAGVHLLLASAAVAVVVAARRWLPRAWIAFTGLYLLPSLALGIVGLGRYANECFPAFAAGGDLLERRTPATRTCVFGAFVVGQVLFACWVITWRHLP